MEKYSSFKLKGLEVNPADSLLDLKWPSSLPQWEHDRYSQAHKCVQLVCCNWWRDLLEGRRQSSSGVWCAMGSRLGKWRPSLFTEAGRRAGRQAGEEPSVGASSPRFLPWGSPSMSHYWKAHRHPDVMGLDTRPHWPTAAVLDSSLSSLIFSLPGEEILATTRWQTWSSQAPVAPAKLELIWRLVFIMVFMQSYEPLVTILQY